MHRNYDVIIVGGGPAGATLAYELARRGIVVLVIEKARLPRYKCCAGGLTVKAAKLLGTNVDALVDDAISSIIVTFAGDSPYRGDYGETIIYTVTREKLDHALVKRADEAGAYILQGLEARGIEFNNTSVEVVTPAGSFRSQFVVGADGARSVVAKAMGVETNNNHVMGIETRVLVADRELAKWQSRIAIYLGGIPGVYAWVFPKADYLSIGTACITDKVMDLKSCHREFLDSLNLGHYSISRWGSSIIPVCTGQVIVARGRAALLGDAAGLADPLTGEGIYNAVLSAQLAAPVIERSLECGEARLDDYSNSVNEKIVSEMKTAYMFSRVLTQIPSGFFRLLKWDERAWKGCCYLLRGDIDYSTIKNKISTLGGLYNLVLRR